jgi:hypothetical protein
MRRPARLSWCKGQGTPAMSVGVSDTPKSKLKSLLREETQGMFQLIRLLTFSIR